MTRTSSVRSGPFTHAFMALCPSACPSSSHRSRSGCCGVVLPTHPPLQRRLPSFPLLTGDPFLWHASSLVQTLSILDTTSSASLVYRLPCSEQLQPYSWPDSVGTWTNEGVLQASVPLEAIARLLAFESKHGYPFPCVKTPIQRPHRTRTRDQRGEHPANRRSSAYQEMTR